MLQAIVASHLERPEEAESQLKLAIDECKDPLRAEVQLAGYYRQTKRLADAIRVCEAACKRHAEAAVPWMVLSDLHVANADYDSARGCLKSGLNTITGRPEKRSVSIRLAVLEIVHGDRAAGIGLLRELASQDKQEIQARSLLLGVREIQADPAAAAALIGELRQAEGESGLWWRIHQARSWLSSASWSAKQQDITNLLQHCIDADPAWSAPVLVLAGMYERQGDFKKVEDIVPQGVARKSFRRGHRRKAAGPSGKTRPLRGCREASSNRCRSILAWPAPGRSEWPWARGTTREPSTS